MAKIIKIWEVIVLAGDKEDGFCLEINIVNNKNNMKNSFGWHNRNKICIYCKNHDSKKEQESEKRYYSKIAKQFCEKLNEGVK